MENQNQQPNITSPSSRHGQLHWALLVVIAIAIVSGLLISIEKFKTEQEILSLAGPFPKNFSSSPLRGEGGGEGDIKTWKTYRNEEFGFEFRHPLASKVEEDFSKAVNNFLVVDNQKQYLFSLQVYFVNEDGDVQTWLKDFSRTIKYSTTSLKLNGYDAIYALSNSSVADSFYIIKNGNKLFVFDDAGIGPKEILSTFKFIK